MNGTHMPGSSAIGIPNNTVVSSGTLPQSDLFKAFESGDSPTRPPAGSRLLQWSSRKPPPASQSPLPPFHNNSIPFQSTNSFIPNATSTTAQGFAPQNSGFNQMMAATTQALNPLSLDSALPHSLSTPTFHNGFSNHPSFNHSMAGISRDTPTPPGQRNLSKSPLMKTGMDRDQYKHNLPQDNFLQESIGGTVYFYNNAGNEASASQQFVQQPQQQNNNHLVPRFNVYNGPPSHLAHLRPKGASIGSFFTPNELKMTLVQRQMLNMALSEENDKLEVEGYGQLVALEPLPAPAMPQRPGFFLAHLSTTYKANSLRDGLAYCMRRLQNCRLVNSKCLGMVDIWKKLSHCNLVQLQEVFTTKAFGDYSLVYVYDYHPGAETLKFRHFSGISRTNDMTKAMYEEYEGPSRPTGGNMNKNMGNIIPESLIWSYVVQLSSALRAIHAAGLAARTIDPSKILLHGRSKILINCCGIMDVLTFEAAQMNLAGAIQHYQQEDMIGLGRLVVALACSSVQAASRDALGNSLQYISQHYSQDLQNLVTYLLGPRQQGRLKNINDVMPMIGARFYAQLEASQMKVDLLENELSKEVENGRLFRLICKLGTINERPEYNMDPSWSETGDRYLLKLFRDHLFHQVSENGRPWLDMSHIVQTLNKLDAGSAEKIALMSRDEENVLIVSFADLKKCVEDTFAHLFPPSSSNTH